MRRPAGSKAGRRRAAAGPPPPPQPPALAAPLAAALLALALLLAAQPAGAQQLSELQLADVAQSCPVSLRYAVSLGDGRDAKGPAATVPTVPIFVAVVTLQNHENYTIEEWRMGWSFPYGSTIQQQQDIFDPLITLGRPASVDTWLSSDAPNRTVPPGGGELLFSFLGTKGPGETSASNPYNVGAIENVSFNNLRCTMVNAAPAPGDKPGSGGDPLALPGGTQAGGPLVVQVPTDLQVEYTPIEYLGQPIISTFTQFLVRVRNIRNETAVPMAAVSLQYWFGGPVEGAPLFADSNPEQFFTVQCEWATTGCDSVSLSVQPGLEGSASAAFLLNITWSAKAGLLLPSGDNAVPALFLGKGVDVMDLLVTLTTRQGVAQLNSTQDYSFLETPELPVETNSTIIPRRALPNPRIPATLNGTLVWGAPPRVPAPSGNAIVNGVAGNLTTPNPAGNASAAAGGGNGTAAAAAPGLPAGIACEPTSNGQGQNCGLVAVYCCSGDEPVDPFIPEGPPPLAPAAEPNGVRSLVPAGEPVSTDLPISKPPAGPPPANVSSQEQPPEGGGGGGVGMVAGVAGGVAAALALGAAAAFILLRRRRARRQAADGKGLAGQAALVAELSDSGGNGKGSTPRSSGGGSGGGVPLGSAFKGGGSGGDGGGALVEVVVPGRPARPAWGDLSEPGSVQSSPSKAGSLAPLLRTQLSSGRGGLLKFPSGISAGSSSHDNPIFEDASAEGAAAAAPWAFAAPGASTVQSVLPQHVGGWELQSQLVTQQAFAQAAAAAAAQQQQQAQQAQQQAEEEGWRPDVLAMMERKAATAPSMLVAEARQRPRRRQQRHPRTTPPLAAAAGGAGGGGSSSSSDDEGGSSDEGGGSEGCCSGEQADWQLRRSKTWDGHLQASTNFSDSLPLFMRRRTGGQPAQLLHALPPLAPLAPPVLPSSEPAPGVDLDVDYASEVAPSLGRCIGVGGFGAVHEATWRGQRVAVKKLPQFGPDQPCGENMYLALLREIELASKFSSERLVRVFGACTADREHTCIIMELLEGGNLFQRIYDRCKRRMGYLEILQLAHDVAAGLAYLHPSVVHRDLKPQNILLDCEGRAKLADFGISRVKDPTKSYLSQVTNDNGTPMYMAPEQFNGSRVDEKVDVYALGVILNECYTRRQPWRESAHFFQIILKVAINGERPWLDPDCPEPLRRLITKCWHQDPHMRPSCAEIQRLTAFMIQEELRRWEELQNAGNGAAGVPRLRLPTAARSSSLGAPLSARQHSGQLLPQQPAGASPRPLQAQAQAQQPQQQ